MAANERQIGGSHYKKEGAQEHWDIVWTWNLDYFQAQITKYVMRHKSKGGLQDLYKAHHFIEKYIELVGAQPQAPVRRSNAPGRPHKGRGATRTAKRPPSRG